MHILTTSVYGIKTTFADALAYAEQAYQLHRKWSTDARPQEARRADLLREIANHYNYGVAFLDRTKYRKEYERAIRKRTRARILFEELLERAAAYYDAQHAAEMVAARSPEGEEYYQRCLNYCLARPGHSNRRLVCQLHEDSGDMFGGVGESLARYAAKVASAIAAQG